MLSPAALLAPPDGTGRLAVSLFAPETAAEVTARVRAYLAVAYADPRIAALTDAATQDDAAAWAAYAMAYDAKADLVADDDATAVVEGQGSRTTAPDQRQHWRERAVYFRSQYEAVIDAATVAVATNTFAGFRLVRSLR